MPQVSAQTVASEITPSRSAASDTAESISDIYAAYGVKLAGKDAADFAFSPYAQGVPTAKSGGGYELVIERYERPAEGMPEGRFTAVAGGKLLYDGRPTPRKVFPTPAPRFSCRSPRRPPRAR